MTAAEQLRQALADHAAKHGPMQTILGKIKDVNEAEGTCTVEDEDTPPYYGVRLTPVITAQKNLKLIPKAGSQCLMVRIEAGDNDWWMLWAEQIDKWMLEADGTRIEADNQGILIGRGMDGLREVITDLITEIQAIYAPKNVANIAAIQMRINNLLKAI